MENIETFHTKHKDFRVGVISDTQLPPTKRGRRQDDRFVRHLKTALETFQNIGVDMILFAGDIGDGGTKYAFRTYKEVLDAVYGDEKPIVQTIMGNHDHWNPNLFHYTHNHRKAFEQIVGISARTHYVVNGFHFIGASPDSGSMTVGYTKTVDWIDAQLKLAEADSVGKPIFLLTHQQPVDTCYGSDDWGEKNLGRVLEKYPNVINISGHSHYSILDERSVWQGAYTVLSTQSLSYIELETGKENGTIPPNADKTPMGYCIDFRADSFAFRRITFDGSPYGREEKADKCWRFPLPYVNDGRFSFERRKQANRAPTMPKASGTAVREGDNVILTFRAGEDDDFVHAYKVVTAGEKPLYFFSDFYNGLDSMQKTVSLKVKAPKHGCVYKIYAVDSWGAESETCTEIQI